MSTGIKQAINGFLLSCKVEGKSYGIAFIVIYANLCNLALPSTFMNC
ncbi:MAG: hypothetical protein KAV87_16135 [Desulfobacteraceae bacterium]|nr:hypothetical protein [Desulfobacteraceae bacterium]